MRNINLRRKKEGKSHMNTNVKYDVYDIDSDYLDFMQTKDKHIPKSNYETENRNRKFYCGPVMTTADGIDYFVPISHQKASEKVSSVDNIQKYCMPIKNADGNEYGCLDFRFMISSFDTHITKHERTSDNANAFSNKQIDFCLQNKTAVQQMAQRTYTARKYETRNSVLAMGCDLDGNIDYQLEYENICDERAEQAAQKLDGCTNVLTYYGTSVYSTAEMALVLDEVLTECKNLNSSTIVEGYKGE